MRSQTSDRSGRYILQPQSYRAFIPKGLPPVPPIAYDEAMLELLSRADRALGRLDGSTENLPNPDLFVFMYVRKEAVLSSQIEGTQASLIDVLEFEAKAADPGSPQDVEEVVNYVAALHHGLQRVKELPLSLRLIREIHERLMEGVRGSERNPGEFRRSQNWIGPPGSTLATARFVPPPPHEMIEALGNLERFLHDPAPMPALAKVGLAHAQFETIHPFLDGNGRVGRLLITFLLCEREILQRPLLYLSYYFKQNRADYYERLQAVRDRGDWEGWLRFFLEGVYQVAQEAARTARQIVRMREDHRLLLTQRLGQRTNSGLTLLEYLYSRPIITTDGAVEATGLVFNNANTLIRQFESLGLLREMTGRRRNRRFAYQPYLDLFTDDETATPSTL
jgi:Fic family protein